MPIYDPSNPSEDAPGTGGQPFDVEDNVAAANRFAEAAQQQVDLTAQMATYFETLSNLTTQMQTNFEGINKLIKDNTDLLGKTATTHQRINDEAAKNIKITDQQAKRQEQITDYALKREAAEKRVAQAQSDGASALRLQLKDAGMYRDRMYHFGDKTMTEEEFQQGFDENSADFQEMRQRLIDRMATSHRPNTTFSLGEAFTRLSRGDIPGALGELTQSLPGTQRMADFGRATGLDLSIRGQARGGLAGLGMRAAGEAVGVGLPFLASPAALYAGQRYLRQGLRAYQGDLTQGMQTGLQGTAAAREAAGANLRARVEALNPFDALSSQAAQQIAKGIQSQGFSGAIRAAWQDTITDVVKSTGMDASTALGLMDTATNQLGQSAHQFGVDMAGVRDVAKATSLSVDQVAKSMQSMQTAIAPMAGAAGAAQVGQVSLAIQQAFPRGTTIRDKLAPALAGGWQAMAVRAGISPLKVYTQQALAEMPRIIDETVAMFLQIKNSRPDWKNGKLADVVPQMEQALPGVFNTFFPGADVRDIEDLFRQHEKGGITRAVNRARDDRARDAMANEHRGGVRGFIGGLARSAYLDVGSHIKRNNPVGRYLSDTITGMGNSMGLDIDAMRRDQVNYWLQQIHSAGLSPTAQRQILSQIRRADTKEELEAAASSANEVFVNIKMHPSLAGMFTAEPAAIQRYHDHMNGTSGSYGLKRPQVINQSGNSYRPQ